MYRLQAMSNTKLITRITETRTINITYVFVSLLNTLSLEKQLAGLSFKTAQTASKTFSSDHDPYNRLSLIYKRGRAYFSLESKLSDLYSSIEFSLQFSAGLTCLLSTSK